MLDLEHYGRLGTLPRVEVNLVAYGYASARFHFGEMTNCSSYLPLDKYKTVGGANFHFLAASATGLQEFVCTDQFGDLTNSPAFGHSVLVFVDRGAAARNHQQYRRSDR